MLWCKRSKIRYQLKCSAKKRQRGCRASRQYLFIQTGENMKYQYSAGRIFETQEFNVSKVWKCNLPGWRWAAITKVALDRLSRSLHSDVCDSDGCCDAVVHSTISGSGNRRTRAVPNNTTINSKEVSCYWIFTCDAHPLFRRFELHCRAYRSFETWKIIAYACFLLHPCGRGNSATSDA